MERLGQGRGGSALDFFLERQADARCLEVFLEGAGGFE
jgi:hypothetical protein